MADILDPANAQKTSLTDAPLAPSLSSSDTLIIPPADPDTTSKPSDSPFANLSSAPVMQTVTVAEPMPSQTSIPSMPPVEPVPEPVTNSDPTSPKLEKKDTQSTNLTVDSPIPAPSPSDFDNTLKPKKKRFGTGFVMALLLILITLPVGVYFISQQGSLNDVRNRAAGNTLYTGSRCSGTSDSSCAAGTKCVSTPYGYYCGPVSTDYQTIENGSECTTNASSANYECPNKCKSGTFYVKNGVYYCGTPDGTRCTGVDDASCGSGKQCFATPYGFYCGAASTGARTLKDGEVCAADAASAAYACRNSCISGSYQVGTGVNAGKFVCSPGACVAANGSCSASSPCCGDATCSSAGKCTPKPTIPADCGAQVKCSGNSCSVGKYSDTCFVSHYRCKAGTDLNGKGCDSRNGELVKTGSGASFTSCNAIEQIDIYCPICGITENHTTGTFVSHLENSGTCTTGGSGASGVTTTTITQPPVVGACTDIKTYKGTEVLDAAGLAALRPGDIITFAVRGSNNPSKAKFRLNGATTWAESTTKNAAGEFVSEAYTIPTDRTSFTVAAEVFVDGVWK